MAKHFELNITDETPNILRMLCLAGEDSAKVIEQLKVLGYEWDDAECIKQINLAFEYKKLILEAMNTTPKTDRDMLFGLGEERLNFWAAMGIIPFPKQVEVLMCEAKETYICSSRGAGKSEIAMIRCIEELLMPDRIIYLIAPTYDLCSIVFGRVMAKFRDSDFLKQYIKKITDNSNEHTIETKCGKGSFLKCLSADNPDSPLGKEADLILIDEAAIVKDETFNYIKPALNRKNRFSRLFSISTPRVDNWFAKRFLDAMAESNVRKRAFALHVLDNPHADPTEYWEEKKFVEKFGSAMDKARFEQEYEGRFDAISGDVFFFTDDIWFPKDFYTPKSTEPIVIGVDYARLHDFTVCTAFTYDGKMIGYDRFNQLGDDVITNRIVDFIESLYRKGRQIDVYIDCSGEGTAVPRDVEKTLKDKYKIYTVNITGIKFTNKNKEEMIDELKLAISKEKIALWNIPEIKDELRRFNVTMSSTGKLIYKASGSGKDDIVMSLALSVSNIPDFAFSVH